MAYTFKHGDRPLDGLTVQRAVGRGGFGEVYYALTDAGKQLAVKYLRDNAEIELRGIANVLNLKSPHLITIYDVRRDPRNDAFVLMEYVSGPSLRDLLIAEPNGLGTQKSAFFLTGLCKGLSYLHDRGIVHRDLKPGNVFYDDGYVKIGDYGLSKYIPLSRHSGQTISVGTVHYMAPEIGSGQYTKAIDIYALGVMLFEMLTGRVPFAGSSMAEILMRHLTARPDLADIPEPFAGVITKALAKDPEERYQDANEMLDALLAGGVGESVASFDPSSLTRAAARAADAGDDTERTHTASPRPRPVAPLDVHERTPRMVFEADLISGDVRVGGKAGGRLARLERKFENKLDKWERKLVQRGFRRVAQAKGARGRDAAGAPAPPRVTGGHRFGMTIMLLAITAALAGAGVLLAEVRSGVRNEPAVFFGLFFMMAGSVIGGLVAHFGFLQRIPVRNPFLDRLAYASTAGIFSMLALAPFSATHDDLRVIVAAPLVAMVLCDWSTRIEQGRRGDVNGWSAFWPAIIGLATSAMLDAEEFSLLGGAATGAIVLLTQSAAGMWPTGGRARTRSGGWGPAPVAAGAGAAGDREHDDETHAAQREIAGAVNAARREVAGAVQAVRREVADAFAAARGAPAEPATSPVTTMEPDDRGAADAPPIPSAIVSPPWAPPAAPAPAQPSFAGRAANAGLAFVAKLIILGGMVVAIASAASMYYVALPGGRVLAWDDDHFRAVRYHEGLARGTIPTPLVAAPFVVGTVLLLIARRQTGWAHVGRAWFGAAAGLAAVALALGPANSALRHLYAAGGDSPPSPEHIAPLLGVAATASLTLLLLFWPRASRQRVVTI
ncbi:MAG: protein kinase [Phycisphaerae bacterium]